MNQVFISQSYKSCLLIEPKIAILVPLDNDINILW